MTNFKNISICDWFSEMVILFSIIYNFENAIKDKIDRSISTCDSIYNPSS
jgi:hypothetical protein